MTKNIPKATLRPPRAALIPTADSLDRLNQQYLQTPRVLSRKEQALVTLTREDSAEQVGLASKVHLAHKLTYALVEGTRDDMVNLVESNRALLEQKRPEVDQKNILVVCDTLTQYLFDAEVAILQGGITQITAIATRPLKLPEHDEAEPRSRTITVKKTPGLLGRLFGQEEMTVAE